MQNRDYTIDDLKRILIVAIILLSVLFMSFIDKNSRIRNLQESFSSGEVLICSDTLIVTNSNWKLTDTNLINDNSAGYLDIHKCSVKK